MSSPEATRAESLIRHYFDQCNAADREGLISCFTKDAVHYFPPGLLGAPWKGADAIADGWINCVNNFGSKWTIEKMLVEHSGHEAVIEWTHWKTDLNEFLRGDEWYIFNEDVSKICEIRAYYASPVDKTTAANELLNFNYDERGYHLEPPTIEGRN